MTDRLFGCAFVSENEAKNDAGINNRAATYANGFIAGKFCVFSANPAEERPLF